MVIKKFMYQKDEQVKSYSVSVLRESASDLEGLSLDNLSEEEYKEVVAIFKEFETKLNPYVKKAWRKFSTNKIIQVLSSEKV